MRRVSADFCFGKASTDQSRGLLLLLMFGVGGGGGTHDGG